MKCHYNTRYDAIISWTYEWNVIAARREQARKIAEQQRSSYTYSSATYTHTYYGTWSDAITTTAVGEW